MVIGDIKANRDYFFWLRHWAGYMSGKTVCERIKLSETTGDEHYYDDIIFKGL
jgi:hypothetical protein